MQIQDFGAYLVKKEKGFTLIELMVVVAIVGIFASVARPFFKEYQVETNRSDVQAEMVRIAQQLHFFYAVNSTFSGANTLGMTNKVDYPVKKPLYEISLALSNNNTSGQEGVGFVLTATPKTNAMMKGDGVICINHRNQKHYAAKTTNCTLSDTSKWYGE